MRHSLGSGSFPPYLTTARMARAGRDDTQHAYSGVFQVRGAGRSCGAV